MKELNESPRHAGPSAASSERLLTPDDGDSRRRTWELELIISGAVVFALLGVPGWLDEWFFEYRLHGSQNQVMVGFMGYYYLQLIAYSLIVSFCTNLAIRSYWIGLVGLHKVFPDGPRWSEAKDGPISKQLQQAHPTLPQLIDRSDKASSLVFSSSFLIIFIFIFSIVMVAGLSLTAWLISPFVFGGEHQQRILYLLLVLFLVPPTLSGLFDKSLIKKPRSTWEGRWYTKPLAAVLKFFFWITLRPLSTAIQQTLGTNIARKYTIPLFVLTFLALVGFFTVSFTLKNTDTPAVHSYAFFPESRVARGMDPGHYENLRPEGRLYPTKPSIQADIIVDPFLKLFIPYAPSKQNSDLMLLCPDFEPLPRSGFMNRRSDAELRPADPRIDQALDCLSRLYTISLNDTLITPTFDFTTQSQTGIRGIIAYLPVEGLPAGRNQLHLQRIEVADEDEDSDAEEEGDPPTEYFIPFWI
ncbi:MAG: hypothetical protein AAF560_29560 [Acidobacteriota bacterium]